MTTLQLQLNLWDQLAQAQRSPQAVDWQQLCLAFDTAIDRVPVELKLATAADAIVEMADLFAARADEFFSTWRRVPEDGPVLDEDLFVEFVRQSFHLDLDGLVGVPELYVRTLGAELSASEKSHEDTESEVTEVSKEKALLLAAAEPEPVETIAQLEHDEDITAWANAITLWMKRKGVESVSMGKVVSGTRLPAVKVWIAGLLSNFELQQTKDFYNCDGLILSLDSILEREVVL